MKKSKKILLIVAAVCILLGAAMMAAAWQSLVDMESGEIATMQFEETTHTIAEEFDDIIINTQNSTIEILPSSDGTCRVVCDDNEKMFHQVSFQKSNDGTVLYIAQHNEWEWYETLDGLHWQEDPVLTLYLPKSEYEVVDVITGSGDITIAPDFRFRTLSTNAVSGNTKLAALSAENLQVRSTSGDISVRSAQVKDNVYLQNISGFTRAENIITAQMTTYTSSGDTTLECITSDHLRSESVSGHIRVYNSSFRDTSDFESSSGQIEIVDSNSGEQTVQTVSGSVTMQNVNGSNLIISTSSSTVTLLEALYSSNVLCNTVSGEIMFTGLDAANLELITSSGDVSGNLLSPKNFITETSSGYVDVPPSDESAGTCHISTISGNISIAVES